MMIMLMLIMLMLILLMMIMLTMLRWLLPKGEMSRDQFSQLMLVYTGMAADIAEIFEAFRESKVRLFSFFYCICCHLDNFDNLTGDDPAPPDLRHTGCLELESPPVLSRHRCLSQVQENSGVGLLLQTDQQPLMER